jgi:hypothetical protein
MTTGQHANLKLYYSTDQGNNWTEFVNIQTRGARYVTMEKSAEGSLYLFFEDQSLNDAGGYTDYNHYPLNFIEITRDHLKKYITNLDDYNIPDFLEMKDVKNSVYQTGTGCDSYGSLTNTGNEHWARTWTSNGSSGMAGLTVSTENGYGFDKATILNTRVMTLRPSANGATDTYTITAPAGYIIKGYTIGGAVYSNGTYRITAADGTTTGDITSTTTPTNITVTGVNASSTTFQFYGASQANWFAITNFVITLAKPLALNVVGDKSYSTLYVPFDVQTEADTKAYYIKDFDKDEAKLNEVVGGKIPAKTAVVLINENASAQTTLELTSTLDPVISEEENMLKGTLVPIKLDLSNETSYYSLGRLNGNIGFYKFKAADGTSTITLGANKAYLDTSTSTINPVRGFKIGFASDDSIINDNDGFVDGINEVQATDENIIYDLNGLRVNTLRKGIYIVNGKKIVITDSSF